MTALRKRAYGRPEMGVGHWLMGYRQEWPRGGGRAVKKGEGPPLGQTPAEHSPRLVAYSTRRTFPAWGPFGPWLSSNSTLSFSLSER